MSWHLLQRTRRLVQQYSRATTQTKKPLQVSLDTIFLNPDCQIRNLQSKGGLVDPVTRQRYAAAMQAGAIFPPILVRSYNGPVSNQFQWELIDGFHRYYAASDISSPIITAIVSTSQESPRTQAVKANAANGLPLSKADWRNAFRAMVEDGLCFLGGRKYVKEHVKNLTPFLRSLRDITKDLHTLGLDISHVSVRSWLRAGITDDLRSTVEAIRLAHLELAGFPFGEHQP